ncbi:hypothetical protein EYF80_049146 [Liparis tanakae]|uniref:Uncharacterized protein n=1 Tax=Liparis tanakae TaxID=230148 RepID=A0A4Z2FHG6_9TELE|nr:hypothetical protein EYF80_049146 [Liparis tanakae]
MTCEQLQCSVSAASGRPRPGSEGTPHAVWHRGRAGGPDPSADAGLTPHISTAFINDHRLNEIYTPLFLSLTAETCQSRVTPVTPAVRHL